MQSQEKLHTLDDYQSIPLIPEVHLSAAEFADPIGSIMKLRQKYEGFGAVKICPPSTWKPNFCFGIEDKAITTRKQVIQELIQGKVQSFFFILAKTINKDTFAFLNLNNFNIKILKMTFTGL